MAKESKIQWTHATFNPWIGCTKVSPGCEHCYAEAQDARWGHKRWGPTAPRTVTSDGYWKQPLAWNAEAAKSGKPFRVFCASLADVCEDRPDLVEPRARLMRLIEATPFLTWLLTTKRPENFRPFFGARWGEAWPKNVWAMTTAEDQARANTRIPHLLGVPSIVRAVSYEPALGPVDFSRWMGQPCARCKGQMGVPVPGGSRPCPDCIMHQGRGRGVDWVIVGGESGPGARPFDIYWAQDIIDQCRNAGAAPFVKQLGALPVTTNANLFDFPEHVKVIEPDGIDGAAAAAYKLRDKKGGDMAEWPEELRVREFPEPSKVPA